MECLGHLSLPLGPSAIVWLGFASGNNLLSMISLPWPLATYIMDLPHTYSCSSCRFILLPGGYSVSLIFTCLFQTREVSGRPFVILIWFEFWNTPFDPEPGWHLDQVCANADMLALSLHCRCQSKLPATGFQHRLLARCFQAIFRRNGRAL